MKVRVSTATGGYDVHIVEHGLDTLGPLVVERVHCDRAFVVSNPQVAQWYLQPLTDSLRRAGVTVETFVIPDGEEHKTLETWQQLVAAMLAARPTRATPVLALGGGVTGDIAGFAAATVLRGLPLVQVPTSLLAMVDSSVGGKTGVNALGGKNLVGSFYAPALVYISTDVVSTLPDEEYRSGIGEVVKHAVIADAALFGYLRTSWREVLDRTPAAVQRMVSDSVRIKSDIVSRDEREAGVRVLLNSGHTVGHALESAAGLGTLRHGECVGLGLLAETNWAVATQGAEKGMDAHLAEVLELLGLPVSVSDFDMAVAIDAARVDKKWTRGKLNTAVPVRIGQARVCAVTPRDVADMLRALPRAEEDGR